MVGQSQRQNREGARRGGDRKGGSARLHPRHSFEHGIELEIIWGRMHPIHKETETLLRKQIGMQARTEMRNSIHSYSGSRMGYLNYRHSI